METEDLSKDLSSFDLSQSPLKPSPEEPTEKPSKIPKIMIFRPTYAEFQDFSSYIKYMESCGAHKAGIAKVVPPKEYIPRKNGYESVKDMMIPAPISQVVTGKQGLYQQINIQKKAMSVREFEEYAESK
jgi:jumonji domain-containing protein 2